MKNFFIMPIKFLAKLFGIVLIILLIAVVAIIAFFLYKDRLPTLEKDYMNNVKTGGSIEQHYLQRGLYETSHLIVKTEKPMKKYTIYYPSELESTNKTYPLVLITNGTGFKASKYEALLEHLASWGFVVIGNEHTTTGLGDSSNLTLGYMLEQNKNSDSPFYQKIDTSNIGITGFSQGGAGVFNAITSYENSHYFKTAVALSPANEEIAIGTNYPYDLTKINVPIMVLAGTSGRFETEYVIPFETMIKMYEKINAPKVMARRIGADHDMMQYSADGYVTAWFMWQLQGDQNAAMAFSGDEPELFNNNLYQDVDSNLP